MSSKKNIFLLIKRRKRKGYHYYVVNGDWRWNDRNWFQNGSFTDIDSSLTKRDKYSLDFKLFNDEYCAPILIAKFVFIK